MEPPSVVETHISVLFFLGDRVYKLRKPVKTPFLDFSTPELRRADCLREVNLNRRLASDVYLGVAELRGPGDEPPEHFVVMRRLPDDRRLSTMVDQPGFDVHHLVEVARTVAAFHERAARSPTIDVTGSTEHLRFLWTASLDHVEQFEGRFVPNGTTSRMRCLALGYLEGRHRLFEARVRQGRIVDGHGDLLAQDIFCMDDGPRILDCIEFDQTFRHGDVLLDTAFLAMDLERMGRPELARRFLDAYREFAAETHPSSLEHWYVAYRALVRSKIACLNADGGRPAAAEEAAALAGLALDHLEEATVRLVLVGGLPGTGKSTVATGLADRFGWTLLRSDEVRKELAGLAPSSRATAAPFEGLYAPEHTVATYDELLRRARVDLAMGDSVVLDASWLDPDARRAARQLAADAHATLCEVCCTLPMPTALERVMSRAAAGDDPSDATPEVLVALAERGDVPWEGSVAFDTESPVPAMLDHAARLVRPGHRTGPAFRRVPPSTSRPVPG